ncbi:MAG: cofactor assembly of complex C subunit B [Proteobacteria bacterium]|nr:cofactor assembly of complex C subunit B [Pseudomonadota bacterium]
MSLTSCIHSRAKEARQKRQTVLLMGCAHIYVGVATLLIFVALSGMCVLALILRALTNTVVFVLFILVAVLVMPASWIFDRRGKPAFEDLCNEIGVSAGQL